MAYNDELEELFDMARRALEAQADLGHRELIFEQREFSPETATTVAAADPVRDDITSEYQEDLITLSDKKTAEPTYTDLESHYKDICDCTRCRLAESRTKFVYGVGNSNAGIMFVGEAPGRDEDLKGEPFVGRAGKLLDKILAAMGLSREDVYIANVNKCRPPNNRDPQPDEMATCLPYLREQIRIIRPKLLCALGRIAAHGLLQTTTPLGKLRGQWHEFEGIPVIVTYHPAALLRFTQYKRPTWEDMQTLMAKYEELTG